MAVAATETPEQQKDSLRHYVSHSLDLAGGDLDEALDLALNHLRQNRDLFNEIADSLVRHAVRDLLSVEMRHRRQSALGETEEPSPTPAASASRGAARILATASDRLMHYPLRGGKALGEATRGDLGEQAQIHQQLAASNAAKARWFDAIQQRLPNGKVRDHLTEEDLRAIWEDTTRE
jgi:hypothetical protein